MKNVILENQTTTSNSKQIALLKTNFPSCFDKQGKFLPDKMAEIAAAEGLDLSREGYSLNWLGKSYARLLANLNTETLLSANQEHNQKAENRDSRNLLIQGDNLDVLKHLKHAYSEQIKMIYIDPPYNTGSDGFVYSDDRKFNAEELAQLAGIDERDATRILEFTRSKPNSHSAWLTFLYPRLYVARELLSEEGAIFISIDDNEQAQLKILCDEVFGEENFVAQMVLDTGSNKSGDSVKIQTNTEYCLCYGKNLEAIKINKIDAVNESVRDLNDAPTPLDTRKDMGYTIYFNPDENDFEIKFDYDKDKIDLNDVSKVYSDDSSLIKKGYHIIRPGMRNKKLHRWRWGAETLLARQEELVFSKSGDDGYKVGFRQSGFNAPKNILKFGTGTTECKALFDGISVFDNPKSTKLIRRLVCIASDDDDYILDFFAGSGTTAHAVMAVNAEDGGRRKHITVQADEATDPKSDARKAGYDTIYEITRERIIRAAKAIKANNPNAECDFGFKEYRITPLFEGYLDEADTPEQYSIFDGDKLSQEQRDQLLLTWQVYDGLPLNLTLNSVDMDGYEAYQGEHILYLINSSLALSHIVAMLERIDTDPDFAPRKIVIFESVLSSKAKREITEAIKGYNNHKQIELHLEVRF